MIVIPGYKINEFLYESSNSAIYRGVSSDDKKTVVLKILNKDYPEIEELNRFKREYEIALNLNIDGTIKAHALKKFHNSFVMIVEDFGGEPLTKCFAENKYTLVEKINLFIKVVDIVDQIHLKNIIHKDINPSNIIWNPQTDQLKIIDFGISSVLTRENPEIKNPNVLEGTLLYMSPEQTGRMNRSIDYRTDYYSLGVTFYELLTGSCPFTSNDPIELVHSHIAKTPPAPSDIKIEIPGVVSGIVLKLLAKSAEERYQSSYGLRADLVNCLHQLDHTQAIEPFKIGAKDIPLKFQISQKLYGRESEIEAILHSFDRVCQGSKELMLVAGYSGIGKTTVVHEVNKPILAKRGFFIRGKFGQFQRDIPYSSLIQAFQDLIRQILTESEEKINSWKKIIMRSIGSNGQLIIDVIPDLELIIGKQPVVPTLPPAESQNRFNHVFQQFICTFSTHDHPLVIFLDNLQWADSSSIEFVRMIMTSADTNYLLMVGAFRDNETTPSHPLMLTVDEIRKSNTPVHTITLKPLETDHINQLIADTLNRDFASCIPLSSLCHKKTLGNPFF